MWPSYGRLETPDYDMIPQADGNAHSHTLCRRNGEVSPYLNNVTNEENVYCFLLDGLTGLLNKTLFQRLKVPGGSLTIAPVQNIF